MLSPIIWARKQAKLENSADIWLRFLFIWVMLTLIGVILLDILLTIFSVPTEYVSVGLLFLTSATFVYFMPIYIDPLGSFLSDKIGSFLEKIESKIDTMEEKYNETLRK